MDNVSFGPFQLDPVQRLLTRPGATTALRPKTLEVLLLLLNRGGEVVSKEEIIATVWEGNAVSDYVLTTCISELRAALGEPPKQPRYIKTVHRTGYRFVVDADGNDAAISRVAAARAASAIVGRERELARLNAALQRAHAGERQIVFVTGEMGIGKTTLANHMFTELAEASLAGASLVARRSSLEGKTTNAESSTSHERRATSNVLMARGQCIEQFGANEPYMPVLEAIGRLGRDPDSPAVIDVLRRHAPAWLAQIPGLLPADERAELRREAPAQTQEYMLRQIADGIEALSEDHLLVLLLEDLHLSDHATLELVAALALRRGPAHLLIVGTFRAAEVYAATAPFQRLKQQLLLHRQCEEIALAPLNKEAVDNYLAKRFAGLTLPAGLTETLHERTEGNPLFIGRLVDHFIDDGIMSIDEAASALRLGDADLARHVPHSLRAMIEQRTDSLSDPEREVLEAASVAGVGFWSAGIAAAVDGDREEVEELCTQLCKRHGFLVVGRGADISLPDLGARYGFSHALYQQVLYERIEATRRQRLHGAIGNALRQAWGARAGEVAAELATHFELGGDPASAVEFFDKAAAAAAGQGANREAVGYLDRALVLLERSGDDQARRERQLDLLMTRGPSVLATSGYGSEPVFDNYQRALELARQLGNSIRQMGSLLALSTCQQTRGNLDDGERLAVELVQVGEQFGLPAPILAQMHNPLSQVRMYKGEVLDALALADAAVAGMRMFPMPASPPDSRPAYWADPSVMLHCQHGAVSFAAGRFAQASAAVEEALRIARELRHPFNQASACTFAALYEDTTGQWERAIAMARQAIESARVYDFPFWQGIAQIFCGHAMVNSGNVEDGLKLLREGMELWRGTGARLANSNHLNLLADACLVADDVAAAEAALGQSEAHAAESGERVFLAETCRLQAECRRRAGDDANAVRAVLQRAIEVAQEQGTKLWELRATLALHRLRPSAKSRKQLQAISRDFDAEPETRDVAAVRQLLAAG